MRPATDESHLDDSSWTPYGPLLQPEARRPDIARTIEAEARLRQKNQVTLPEAIVRALDAAVDDTIVFEADPAEPGVARLHLVPRDFAGSMTGVYGTSEDVLAFVRGERAAWGE